MGVAFVPRDGQISTSSPPRKRCCRSVSTGRPVDISRFDAQHFDIRMMPLSACSWFCPARTGTRSCSPESSPSEASGHPPGCRRIAHVRPWRPRRIRRLACIENSRQSHRFSAGLRARCLCTGCPDPRGAWDRMAQHCPFPNRPGRVADHTNPNAMSDHRPLSRPRCSLATSRNQVRPAPESYICATISSQSRDPSRRGTRMRVNDSPRLRPEIRTPLATSRPASRCT